MSIDVLNEEDLINNAVTLIIDIVFSGQENCVDYSKSLLSIIGRLQEANIANTKVTLASALFHLKMDRHHEAKAELDKLEKLVVGSPEFILKESMLVHVLSEIDDFSYKKKKEQLLNLEVPELREHVLRLEKSISS